MKTIITMLSFVFLVSPLVAQKNNEARNKIQRARIGLISERLNLTPEQAEKFWPLYRQFLDQKKSIQTQFKDRLGGIDPKNATEEETKKVLELRLELKQRELSLEKEYSERLLNVITSKQLVSLRQAEQEFRKKLLEMIKKRQNQNRARQNNARTLEQERNKKRRGN